MNLSTKQKQIVSINLTPLVDVSLVLVVIFMATAPMLMQKGITVFPGEKKNESDSVSTSPADDVLITLEKDRIIINRQTVSWEQLPNTLQVGLQRSLKKRIVIRPGQGVVHGDVVRIMDTAKQCGAKKLVIWGATH